VILEVDNLSLANLIRSEEGIRSTIFGISHKIRELSNVFVSLDVSFVPRKVMRLLTGVRVFHRKPSLFFPGTVGDC